MRKRRFILFVLVFSIFLHADTKNPDKPALGTWDFQLEKIWEIETAGEDVFGQPFVLTVADDATLYVFDIKNGINYIFDSKGGFVKTFAKGGQGPGEIIGQELTHVVKDRLIIPGMNGIHYFSRDGDYIKTIKQVKTRRTPRLFIDEDNMIAAPMTAVFHPEGKTNIVRKNLKTEEEIVIADFSLDLAGVASSGQQVIDIIVVGLSPLMTLALSDNTLFWGLSDSYIINISDLRGERLDTFSVNRKKRKISDSSKMKYFRNDNLPQDILPQLVKSFPNELTHFYRIENHRGLIYIFVPELDLELGRAKMRQIDIFSQTGKYLYRASVDFGKNLTHLFSPLRNFVIKGDYIYAACEREDDTIVIIKYKASFPRADWIQE